MGESWVKGGWPSESDSRDPWGEGSEPDSGGWEVDSEPDPDDWHILQVRGRDRDSYAVSHKPVPSRLLLNPAALNPPCSAWLVRAKHSSSGRGILKACGPAPNCGHTLLAPFLISAQTYGSAWPPLLLFVLCLFQGYLTNQELCSHWARVVQGQRASHGEWLFCKADGLMRQPLKSLSSILSDCEFKCG